MWILGWALFLAHFLAAFHFYHQWSHEHAILDTAQQTQALLGWEFGEGIYFSYLFLVIWTIDAVWYWRNPDSYLARKTILSKLVNAYIFFIAFNGTVVFESGAIRWAALATCVVLFGLWTRKISSR